jgi:hypothetical protein
MTAMGAAGVSTRAWWRPAAALLMVLASPAGRHAAAGAIVRSDNSALCQTNLAACERQCAGGQYTFQCDGGGTFDRPTSTCQCVRLPTGITDSGARRSGLVQGRQSCVARGARGGRCGGGTGLAGGESQSPRSPLGALSPNAT